jgi:hypothetical protein
MRNLILTAAFVAMCGGALAQPPTELIATADSVRPSLIEAMKPYMDKTPTIEQSVCVGIDACRDLTLGKGNTVAGAYSGRHLQDGDWNVLVGACTATPTPSTSNFVNIANKLCFWRDTGQRVACPAPEPECGSAPQH